MSMKSLTCLHITQLLSSWAHTQKDQRAQLLEECPR